MSVAKQFRLHFAALTALLIVFLFIETVPAFAIALRLQRCDALIARPMAASRPHQLAQSRAVQGHRNIAVAWLAAPTDRYRHGILGDDWEASRLIAETVDGRQLKVDLPATRVFEDLEPRLADVTGDNQDEILVVESDLRSGAALAVYGIVAGRLERITATAFLGRPNRWLNPVGVGDFDGDGRPDIALVATPHIGGILRLYRLSRSDLVLFAEYPGVSTHRIGSTELGLGQVVPGSPRDRLLVPNQSHRRLMLLEWDNKWHMMASIELPDTLISSLIAVKENHWQFKLKNGKSYTLQLVE